MKKTLDFSGKTILVVGGSSGIGNAIAQDFLAAGAEVHVWGTRDAARAYQGEAGCDLTGLRYAAMDVSDHTAIERYQPPFAKLDVLVLSQGMVLYKRQEFAMPGFTEVLNVNLTSLMACALKFEAMLAQTQGCLLIVSSSAAFHATKGNPAYSASKAGAVGLTRTLAQAWAAQGIRVNGIAPGYVSTKMTKATIDNPRRLAAVEESIPMGRIAAAAEIAGVALFLASPLASYILGQTILVDGGMLL